MQRPCDACGKLYEAQRATSKFCSSNCRARSHAGLSPAPVASQPMPSLRPSGPLEAVTERTLTEAGRIETVPGQQAMALAREIESRPNAGMGSAALHKALSDVMVKAMEGVQAAADPLDEIKARRDRRLNAG